MTDDAMKVERRAVGEFPDTPGKQHAAYEVTLPDGQMYRWFIPAAVPTHIAEETARHWTTLALAQSARGFSE